MQPPEVPIHARLAATLFVAAVLLGAPAASTAQEQTGRAEGTVRAQHGGVLAGATVLARNLTVGSVTEVTTNQSGAFRFVALGPGMYDVTASRSGFRPMRFVGVEILLGQVKRLDFTLAIGGLTDEANVTADSPLVDVRKSARAVSLRQDQLTYLPRGLDFASVVPLVSAANNEQKLGGLSVDGPSAAENRFIIDGIDTTNAISSLPGRQLSVDNVEELQIKSSGYSAEYGGSTGGVVNVLTKSGTNSWHGDVRFSFKGDWLDAGPRPTLRRNPQVSTQAEYITYPEDPYNAFEPGGSLGGPIKTDRAWFYIAYQPYVQHTEQTVPFALDASTGTFGQDLTRQLLTASQSWQLGSKLRTRAAFNYSPTKTVGLLPALAGSDSPVSNFDVTMEQPSWSVSGTADFLGAPRFLVSGRVGYTYADRHNKGVRNTPRYGFAFSNIGLLDVPPGLQRVTGFTTDTNNYEYIKDKPGRLATQVDASWFASGWGDHVLKGGVQADCTTHDTDRSQAANVISLYWNRPLLGMRGKYGHSGSRPTARSRSAGRSSLARPKAARPGCSSRTTGRFLAA